MDSDPPPTDPTPPTSPATSEGTAVSLAVPKDHPFGVSYLPGRRVEVCEVTR